MRFKFALEPTLLIIVAVYILQLGVRDNLALYIHPRYILFTTTMTVIGLVLFTAHFISGSKQKSTHGPSMLGMIPLSLILLFALFVPARSLTSATISQRSTDAGSLVATADSRPVNTLFAGSSKGLKLADWSRLLSTNTDPSYYANKPAKISGFIYDAELGQDTVLLARFVVTCCAVDAQPIGVAVRLPNWESLYDQDQWLEVEGEFGLVETANGEQLVLNSTNVSEIDQPRNPYAN